MPKFRMMIGTGFASAKHEEIYEIDDGDWEQMSEEEREEELNTYLQDMLTNYVETWYEEA